MDVYCEVCGIVTTVSGGARGGAAIECRVCGSAMLGARGRGTAGLPAAGAAARSSRPPPPLRRSSAPPVPRHDDDPTMMDLRSLALKSVLATDPAPRTAAAPAASSPPPGGGPAAPAGVTGLAAGRVAASMPVAVDAPPSVNDVLRVYGALAPVATPSGARHRVRVGALVAASAAGALAIAVLVALVARQRPRAPEDALLPAAQRGVSRAGEIAREVSAPADAPGQPGAAPRGREALAPGSGEAGAAERGAAPAPAAAARAEASAASGADARTAASAGVRALAAAGARAASASGARARPARPPAPPPAPPASEEAPRPAPPVSLTDAMAAAVAGTPPPAAAQPERQADQSEE
ncbi:hypothetical protein WMF20_04245 [Sorangium sp. So ce834]|uniref:hypothetical protein n=1 Tax=Sorangium sp. So ce834 TaxID=3133321 RepID=UPI003F613606